MIKFLIYVAIVLTVVAIGYLVRVFELAQALKGKKSEEITDSDNRLMSKFMLGGLFFLFAFVAWQLKEYGPRMLPEAASEHGKTLDMLMDYNLGLLWVVFVITQILLFYFAFKYYGRKGNVARYFPHNNKLEMIWTVIPALVLAVVIIFGIKTWNQITDVASEKAIVIEMYSKQFDWTGRYAGKDNQLGDANYKLITGTNELGLDSASQAGMDDIVVKNELHIPKGKEIEFKFRSRDVIHSAYFPHFRAQMNTVPGMTTMLHFTPTITTAEMREKTGNPNFDYIVLCNKICGNSHYNMQMTIVVESEEEYNKWLEGKKPFFGAKAEAPKEEVKTEVAEK
jgi:cytochrome c oxidase subunit 2